MGSTVSVQQLNQLQASSAQAVTDIGGDKHHHADSAYITGNPPVKRTRLNENTDMRSQMVAQYSPPTSDPNSRTVVAS